ncbi:uncharacterized protein LOC118646030 [Monomorium pharaonis]|uniref:uncharacterized protein LOC118646030 n=1 Tax=Monomorium pharaonis TaxID=307658 RepID=UPI00174671C0|nr:uncharacterized protein LOC118646030 [Monomorium pharaonis]
MAEGTSAADNEIVEETAPDKTQPITLHIPLPYAMLQRCSNVAANYCAVEVKVILSKDTPVREVISNIRSRPKRNIFTVPPNGWLKENGEYRNLISVSFTHCHVECCCSQKIING